VQRGPTSIASEQRHATARFFYLFQSLTTRVTLEGEQDLRAAKTAFHWMDSHLRASAMGNTRASDVKPGFQPG
jgi:hypothetical protein